MAKINMVPRLPHETKNFASYSFEERALWEKLFTIKEDKGETVTLTTRNPELVDTYLAYKSVRDQIKALEEMKSRLNKILYEALVGNMVGEIKTPAGSFSMTAFTREEMDKEYLRVVAPEGFTVVPDRLQVNVK